MAKLKQAGGDIWYYIDRGGKIKRNWQRLNKKEIDTSGKKLIDTVWTKKKFLQVEQKKLN